jgi:hypothetical protein
VYIQGKKPKFEDIQEFSAPLSREITIADIKDIQCHFEQHTTMFDSIRKLVKHCQTDHKPIA